MTRLEALTTKRCHRCRHKLTVAAPAESTRGGVQTFTQLAFLGEPAAVGGWAKLNGLERLEEPREDVGLTPAEVRRQLAPTCEERAGDVLAANREHVLGLLASQAQQELLAAIGG
jgi:hypothetical protein